MDRRRFRPSSLGSGDGVELETRQLMASSVLGSITGSTTTNTLLPTNIQQRLDRVVGLPYIMNSYQRDRALPPSVIQPIQQDLRDIIGILHSPGPAVLDRFNKAIRDAKSSQHLLPRDASALVGAFDGVLKFSGTPDALRAKFTGDMTALAALDATGAEPTVQAINDFSIITELVQLIGQPLTPPGTPSLAVTDQVSKSLKTLTTNHDPHFFGYGVPGTGVRIIDASNGGILAESLVGTNDTYDVPSARSLPDGTYTIVAQSFEYGYLSLASKPYTFRVFTPARRGEAPAGPVRR